MKLDSDTDLLFEIGFANGRRLLWSSRFIRNAIKFDHRQPWNLTLSNEANGQPAMLWEPDDTPRYLGTLGDTNSMFDVAGSINELGEVLGNSQVPNGTLHSWLWTRATACSDVQVNYGATAISTDDNTVGGNKTARLWSAGTGAELSELYSTEMTPIACAWSPTGDQIVIGGNKGGAIRFYEILLVK
jgi:WD40 repeat protein